MNNVLRKPIFLLANNKDADQPVHPRSLVSTFVIRYIWEIQFVCLIWSFTSQSTISIHVGTGFPGLNQYKSTKHG